MKVLIDNNKYYKQAMKRYEYFVADEPSRLVYEARQKFLHDQASYLSDARREGHAEGLTKGLEEGFEKGQEKGMAKGERKKDRRGTLPAERIKGWNDQGFYFFDAGVFNHLRPRSLHYRPEIPYREVPPANENFKKQEKLPVI